MSLQQLDALAAKGEVTQARRLFEQMRKPRVVWNVMLKAPRLLFEAFLGLLSGV